MLSPETPPRDEMGLGILLPCFLVQAFVPAQLPDHKATTASLGGQPPPDSDLSGTASYVNGKFPAIPKNAEGP